MVRRCHAAQSAAAAECIGTRSREQHPNPYGPWGLARPRSGASHGPRRQLVWQHSCCHHTDQLVLNASLVRMRCRPHAKASPRSYLASSPNRPRLQVHVFATLADRAAVAAG